MEKIKEKIEKKPRYKTTWNPNDWLPGKTRRKEKIDEPEEQLVINPKQASVSIEELPDQWGLPDALKVRYQKWKKT